MAADAVWGLLITTFIVAATHTLSPDHWFGFVMLGRTRKWSTAKTLLVSGVAGIGHVGTSVVISVIAVWAGAALASDFASVAEIVTGWALVLFGMSFALYAYIKGGHSHHGIPLVNKILGINNREAEVLMQVHNPSDPVNDHDHDHHHGHHHDHDHPGHDHGGKKDTTIEAGYGLVAIIALTPCILLLPLTLWAGELGMAAVIWTIMVFTITTVAVILVLVAAGLAGLHAIRFGFFEKYGEVITGIVIGIMGGLVVAGFI